MDFATIAKLIQVVPQIMDSVQQGRKLAGTLIVKHPELVSLVKHLAKTQFPDAPSSVRPEDLAADVYFNPAKTRELQEALKVLVNAHLEVDGIYSTETRRSVTLFQQMHQPQAGVVDGYAGPKTWDAITTALAKQPEATA